MLATDVGEMYISGNLASQGAAVVIATRWFGNDKLAKYIMDMDTTHGTVITPIDNDSSIELVLAILTGTAWIRWQ